ncbi:MAG: serine/threonine protein kinase [Myxococcales bacterium]|nr:serine/threonine protein kinase [Myxococcales bacterium]
MTAHEREVVARHPALGEREELDPELIRAARRRIPERLHDRCAVLIEQNAGRLVGLVNRAANADHEDCTANVFEGAPQCIRGALRFGQVAIEGQSLLHRRHECGEQADLSTAYGVGLQGAEPRQQRRTITEEGPRLPVTMHFQRLENLTAHPRCVPGPRAFAIVSDVCGGLHAAHTVADENARPLVVVHRDVSPHNVLVSKSGSVKRTDFGIAKATNMAPERFDGVDSDLRSDIFAAGARDVSARYQTAEELQLALDRFVTQQERPASTAHVASRLNDLFLDGAQVDAPTEVDPIVLSATAPGFLKRS